jgi:hypothetical protein
MLIVTLFSMSILEECCLRAAEEDGDSYTAPFQQMSYRLRLAGESARRVNLGMHVHCRHFFET